MNLTLLLSVLQILACLVKAAPQEDPEERPRKQVKELEKQYQQYVEKTLKARKSGCTWDNVIRRQEWGSLCEQDRKDYIKAVQCLMKQPPRSRYTYAPGSRSRYDDFAAIHLLLTLKIHFSGLFFHWHRHFTWLYEKALRDECGYKGTQPYWDWSINWRDPRKSTVFDASPTSMGGNGEVIAHGPVTVTGLDGKPFTSEAGTGGGCVKGGPFDNLTVDIGNVAMPPFAPDHGVGYNPHCLIRDLNPLYSNLTRPRDVAYTLGFPGTFENFDGTVENITGLHFNGHRQIGGLQLDPYSSPGDPVFYLHHSGVDRMWTIWQGLKPSERDYAVYGTETCFNVPPSPKVTLDYQLYFGDLSPNKTIRHVSSAIDGPYCYMYI